MDSATGRTRIGVDTGGTFTDVVALREGRLWSTKISSTPPAFEQAVLGGVESVNKGAAFDLFHSTTVATNALLERKGAKTALLTTAGFRDLLTIGRQNRPFLYDLFPQAVPPLVPRDHCFEVPERVSAEGKVLLPLDLASLDDLIGRLREMEVESVAVVFLFSFLFPDHERAAGDLLERAGFSVSLSHRILPEFREVERASTTVVNAFVRPVMEAYLGKVQSGAGALGGKGLQIIKSNGGCLRPLQAGLEAVQTVLSGPAAGVLGAQTAVRAGGHGESFITFDMGGTSSDVAMVREKAVIS
ncbi:MAG: hydantoinase/oxoprolinase family protein, partial [Kiritimatiellia bacterium]